MFVTTASSASENHTGGTEGYCSCRERNGEVRSRVPGGRAVAGVADEERADRKTKKMSYGEVGVDVQSLAVLGHEATADLVDGRRDHLKALVVLREHGLELFDVLLERR